MDKVLIVTGGGRGIGAATARLAARQGYAVCVSYVENRAAADAVVLSIQAEGGRAVAVAADVAREGDVSRLFEASDELLGPSAVSCLDSPEYTCHSRRASACRANTWRTGSAGRHSRWPRSSGVVATKT